MTKIALGNDLKVDLATLIDTRIVELMVSRADQEPTT